MAPERTQSRPRARLALLASFALAALAAALIAAGPAGAQSGISISTGSVDKVTGQPVTLTARASRLPPGASIVIIGFQNGRQVYRQTCRAGARVCVRTPRSSTARTIRFRAFVLLRGRLLDRPRSGIVTVRWRPPRPVTPPSPPVMPPIPPPVVPPPVVPPPVVPPPVVPPPVVPPPLVPPPAPRTVLKFNRVAAPFGFHPECGGVPQALSNTLRLQVGSGLAAFTYSVPAELVNGPNTVSIAVSTPGDSAAIIGFRAPAASTFIGPSSPNELAAGPGQTGPTSMSYTFTPPPGDFVFIPDYEPSLQVGSGCGLLLFLYRVEVV